MMVQSSGDIFMSMFMLSASLVCFFLLSLRTAPNFLYYLLTIILFIHGWLIQDVIYTAMLFLLLQFMALYRMPQRNFNLLLGTNFLFTLILTFLAKQPLILTILLGIAFVSLFILLSKTQQEINEKRELYEKLLIEYRQLKRMNVSTEEVAKAEERTRIAREIHDSVGHQLTALMIKLEMLHIEKPNEQYIELKEMASKSLQETREAVQTLREGEQKGITAVVQLIRKLEAESQLFVQFTLKEGVLAIPLSNKHGVVLYRVIQEALTNVMRHATSKQVSITIGKSAVHSLTFHITNPIHVQEKFTLGFGLKNMKERVHEVGGQIDIYQTNEAFIVQGTLPTNTKKE